jgi:chromosome segregation ATPase
MPSLNLDLPQETLDEVSRLAQQLNVHRADVLVRAVGALARTLSLERGLEDLRAKHEETDRRRREMEERGHALDADVARLSSERDELHKTAEKTEKELASLKRDLSATRLEISQAKQEIAETVSARDAAEKRAQEAEERDRRKAFDVMRDAEVDKLRRHSRDVAVMVQELEKELAYQRMEGEMKSRKIGNLTRQLAAATKQKRAFETKSTRTEKEVFDRERRVGNLLKERATLRTELRELARLLNRLPETKAVKPNPKDPSRKTVSHG